MSGTPPFSSTKMAEPLSPQTEPAAALTTVKAPANSDAPLWRVAGAHGDASQATGLSAAGTTGTTARSAISTSSSQHLDADAEHFQIATPRSPNPLDQSGTVHDDFTAAFDQWRYVPGSSRAGSKQSRSKDSLGLSSQSSAGSASASVQTFSTPRSGVSCPPPSLLGGGAPRDANAGAVAEDDGVGCGRFCLVQTVEIGSETTGGENWGCDAERQLLGDVAESAGELQMQPCESSETMCSSRFLEHIDTMASSAHGDGVHFQVLESRTEERQLFRLCLVFSSEQAQRRWCADSGPWQCWQRQADGCVLGTRRFALSSAELAAAAATEACGPEDSIPSVPEEELEPRDSVPAERPQSPRGCPVSPGARQVDEKDGTRVRI